MFVVRRADAMQSVHCQSTTRRTRRKRKRKRGRWRREGGI